MILKLNQKEYADKIGVKQAAISYRIKEGLSLPGIRKIEKFSRFYILHFDDSTDIEEAKKSFKII